MIWTYVQSSGALCYSGNLIATGYSGFGSAKNDPASEQIVNTGPIPRGLYLIGEPFDSEAHGPVVMRLTPSNENKSYGREGFLIHGDSMEHPGLASHGCIILPRSVRLMVAQSPSRELVVI